MGLIEKILEKVITDHAGQFLKINPDQLKTSLIKGEVVLSGVEIKTEALAEMMKMLPFRIKQASIKTLKAKVPWNELNTKAVKIQVCGVEIILAPQNIDESAAGDSWADVIKRQRLLAAEMLMEGLMETDAEERAAKSEMREGEEGDILDDDDAASYSTAQTGASSSKGAMQKRAKMTLVQRIVARILDNLGIAVEGLSIRYETGNDATAFALEMDSLQLFTVSSFGDSQSAVFVDRTVRGADLVMRRRLKIAGLAMVWQRGAARREVIRPLGVGVTLVQHLSTQPTHQFSIEAKTEGSIDIGVGAEEIADMTRLVERITAHDDYVTRSAILKHRPAFSVGVDPAAWWRYAIKAHVIGIRQSRSTTSSAAIETVATTWPKIVSLIQQRTKYVALYKQKLVLEDSKFQARARRLAKASSKSAANLTVDVAADTVEEIRFANELLRELEIVLPFRTIMLFRSFAEAEFRSEKARLKKLHRSKQIPARAISAMVQGATSVVQGVHSATVKRKNFIKALSTGFRKPASTAAAPVQQQPVGAPAATATPPPAAVVLEDEWMLSSAEKQVLYEAVAVDPATEWLLDQTSFATTKTRMGLAGASFEASVVIPHTCVHFYSAQEGSSFFDINVGEVKCKFENLGQYDITQQRVSLALWACDLSLAGMEFIELDSSSSIPGSFTALAAKANSSSPPLLQVQLYSTYLGCGQTTRLRVAAELLATQLVVSFPLIHRFATLIQPVSAPAVTERVQALRQYGARRAAEAAGQAKFPKLDVKIDWVLPTLLLPISQHHTLELKLGKFRAKSSAAATDGLIDVEISGVKLQLRRLQNKSGNWGVLEEDENKLTTALMSNTNFEAKIRMEPTIHVDVNCVSGVSLRLPSIEAHWNAIGKTLAAALDVRDMMPSALPSTTSAAAMWRPTLAVTCTVPKLEVYLAMIPGPGWIKCKMESIEAKLASDSKAVECGLKVSKIHFKDDVQLAGEHFKDLLRIDGKVECTMRSTAASKQHLGLSVDSNVTVNWNSTTMTRLVSFLAKNLMQRKERIASYAPRALRVKTAAIFPEISVHIPNTVLIKLNQEAIGARFGILRFERIKVQLNESGVMHFSLRNMSMYGMQWLPLTATSGVQLFGSNLEQELQRNDDMVSLEMDLHKQCIQVNVSRIRFLWAHTLTKQFADYLTDGVALVFAPLLAVATTTTTLEMKPNLEIKGTIRNASVICPALRFGKEYLYSAAETDEIVLFVDKALMHILVHQNGATPLLPGPTCNASSSKSDATKSWVCENDSQATGPHKLGVEIKIEVTGGELLSHHKRSPASQRRTLASGFTGKLLWRIIDFSPAQLALRKTFQPLTARERARAAYCQKTFGSIPPAEIPKGVSPQKFEMLVDADVSQCVFDFALQDVHLITLVVFENIADHRRRWPKTRAPKMPLYDETADGNADFEAERGFGPDELANGNFGPTSLIEFETDEDTDSDKVDFDGNHNHMVDLDLFLNLPDIKLVLSLEPGSPALVEIHAKAFSMSLTEFYNRSQSVELGLESVEMFQAGKPLLSCTASSFLKNPPALRTVLPKMPTKTRTREEILPYWQYQRRSIPVSIIVTKFPAKDKRVELGIEKLQLHVEFDCMGSIVQSLDCLPQVLLEVKQDLVRLNMPGGGEGRPKKLPRALALELFCNQLVIKRDAVEEVALQGSCRVLIAQSRLGELRGLVESRLGLVLKCALPETEALGYKEEEEEESIDHPQEQADLRSWLESVYRRKNPPKLAEVDSILRAFAHNEAELIRTVSIKYDEVFHGVDNNVLSSSSGKSPTEKSSFAKQRRTSSLASFVPAAPATTTKKTDVALVDPFVLRIDVNASVLRTELQCMVDPIVARVTNGNIELLKSALMGDGTLVEFTKVCNARAEDSKPKRARLDTALQSTNDGPALHFTGMLRGIECTLLNDFGNSQSLPLIRASMFGLAFKLVKDADGLVANLGVVSSGVEQGGDDVPMLRLDHFNPRLLAWEPVLEPWEFALTVHANNAIEFTSTTPLNVNFSYSFAESFANWIAWRSASGSHPLVRSRNHITDHYIVNESGLAVVFGFGKKTTSAGGRRLESGRRAPLGYTSANVEQRRHGDYYRDTRLGLAAGAAEQSDRKPAAAAASTSSVLLVNFDFLKDNGTTFATLQRIPVDSFGTMVYGLGSSKVMVHVTLENGSKVVRVRSPLHVQNNLGRPVDILLASSSGCWALGPLRPNGAMFPIPVDRLNCKLSFRPVTPHSTVVDTSMVNLSDRVELETEASNLMMRHCDENGYAWGPSIKLLELHALVDRPLAMMFERSKSYSVSQQTSPRHRKSSLSASFTAADDQQSTLSEEEISFVQQHSAGYGTQFTCLVGVKSIESQDGNGLRENYVVGIHPAIRVENRLPCDLFCRSQHYIESDNVDVPLGGGRVSSGEDLDFHHVKLGRMAHILHDAETISNELWLTMSLPNGFDWSAPFRPSDDVAEQFVIVPRSSGGGGSIRLLLETVFDYKCGTWQIVVFVESWLVNDARFLVPGLQLRESGVSGEEYLHDFKHRATSMYEKLAKPQQQQPAATPLSPSRALVDAAAEIASPTSPTAAAAQQQEDEQEISLFTEGRNVVVRFVLDGEQPVPCHWSNVLMLDAVGSHADVKCEMEANNMKYIGLLGVSVNVAPNVLFRRSRVVTFAPRLVFVNSTGAGSALYLSSGLHPSFDGLGTKRVERVDSLFFFDPKSIISSSEGSSWSKRICPVLRLAVERVDGTRFGWSGPFQCLDSGGEFTLKLVCHNAPENVMVARIRFEERDACTVVFVEEESTTFPIYRILSHTEEVFEVCQDKMQAAGVERLETKGSSRPFGWTEPNAPKRQVKVIFPNALALNKDVSLCMNLDELSTPITVHLPAFGKSVWCSVRIRGMTKTLLVTDQAPNTAGSASPMRRSRSPGTNSSTASSSQDDTNQILTLFRIDIAQIGLSLIDRAPQELMYLSLIDTVVEFSRTRSANLGIVGSSTEAAAGEDDEIEHLPHIVEALEVSISKFQIDNQLTDAQFQVLLGQAKPQHPPPTATATMTTAPMAQIKLIRRRFPEREEWFDYIELASFEVAELECKLEDSFLLLVGRMAWDCAMSLRSEEELVSGLSSDGAYSRLTTWLATVDPDAASQKFTVKNWLRLRGARAAAQLTDSSSLEKQGKKIYFAVLHILPLCVNFSFRFTATDPIEILTFAQFRTASALRGDDTLNDGFDADQVSKTLPPALINIDSARIRLLALYATHVLGDRQALFKTIAKHYTRQAITQVYYILGSSDLIGNPLGIVTGVAKGVNELVFHPMQGLTNASPVEFVQGVGKGSVSFVRHVLSGTLDSFSKLSGALGAGVALLSLDPRFVSNRWDNLREQRDQTMTGVLTTGASAFAYSLVDGAGGVIYRPFLANTPIEFVRELGKGLVGLAVKPVVGLLDLASRTTHGVSSSLLHFDSWLAQPTSRVRLPRAFRGYERRLDPYSAENALVTLLIKQLEQSENMPMEYLAHAFIDSTLLLVSAGQRLWCLHCVNRIVTKVWHLPLDAVDDIEYTKEPDFPAVRIRFANPSSFVRLTNHQEQTASVRKGGAFDAELIIGGQVGLETQAMLAFHVDTFAKAKMIAARLRKGLRRRRPVQAPPATEEAAPPKRRTLGLVIGPIPRQMRYLAGSGHVGGIAVVLKVVPGSSAAQAGVREGDILLTCDGQALDHTNPKETLLRASETGQDVVIRVKRSQALPSMQFVLKA